MPFCFGCGYPLSGGEIFCPSCGIRVSEIAEPPRCLGCACELPRDADVCPRCGLLVFRSPGLVAQPAARPSGLVAQPAARPSGGVAAASEKSELIAILLAVLVPGLGHLYVGNSVKGLSFLIAATVTAADALISILMDAPLFAIVAAAVYLWNICDALAECRNRNERLRVRSDLFCAPVSGQGLTPKQTLIDWNRRCLIRSQMPGDDADDRDGKCCRDDEHGVRSDLPYDDSSEESILRYARRLTGHTLYDFIESGEVVIGDAHSKGVFGQLVERDFFKLPNNSLAEPDFRKVGLELKVTPMVKRGGRLVSKERLVLGIIDYNKVPDMGFDTFLKKNSHILIVFYDWVKGGDVLSYRFLKCIDWKPTGDELHMIMEDWDIIQRYIMGGNAHLLSEKHTRFLAASTKGAGHGRDYRTQPFSDIPAKQRSLSFKPSFMTSLYYSHPDIGDQFSEAASLGDAGSVFDGRWADGQTFSEYISSRFTVFVGRTCLEIESMLDRDLNPASKQYHYSLVMAMLGAAGKKRIKEFDEAGIIIKTVRIKANGAPKESMSFPAIRYESVLDQEWEDSDFFLQLDHEFLIPVFQFPSSDTGGVSKKELLFRGAFLWAVPDKDMSTISKVWADTKSKIADGRFDEFIALSDHMIAHVRPHARNNDDTCMFRGHRVPKKSFWLNSGYLGDVIARNLDLPGSE